MTPNTKALVSVMLPTTPIVFSINFRIEGAKNLKAMNAATLIKKV